VVDLPFVNIGFEPKDISSTRLRARKPHGLASTGGGSKK
jgi:hypothetical protein